MANNSLQGCYKISNTLYYIILLLNMAKKVSSTRRHQSALYSSFKIWHHHSSKAKVHMRKFRQFSPRSILMRNLVLHVLVYLVWIYLPLYITLFPTAGEEIDGINAFKKLLCMHNHRHSFFTFPSQFSQNCGSKYFAFPFFLEFHYTDIIITHIQGTKHELKYCI